MANRPPRGLQQRILALLAARPNQTVGQNGASEACSERIAKRLSVPEKAILSELETMEHDHLIRVTRDNDTHIIKHIQIAHGVDPAEWAVAELETDAETDGEADTLEALRAVQASGNIDYRQWADNLLIAALAALDSGDSHKAQQKAQQEEIEGLREANDQLHVQLRAVKVERDTNIRQKKEAEAALKEQKNRADEALSQVAELESDLAALQEQNENLEQQIRTVAVGGDILADMDTRTRQQLLRVIQEQTRN